MIGARENEHDCTLLRSACPRNLCQVIPIATRLVVHLLLRTMPTVLICVALYVVLLGEFTLIDDTQLKLSCDSEVRAFGVCFNGRLQIVH